MKGIFRRSSDSSSSEEEDETASSVASQDSAGPSTQPRAVPSSPQPAPPTPGNADPQALNPLTLYSSLYPDIPSIAPSHRTALLISSLLESHINNRLPGETHLAKLLYSDISQQLTALGITPPNSELFSRGELANVRQGYLEGIDSLMQQGLEKRNAENRGGNTSSTLAGDGQMSMVRHDSSRPPLRRMMTDLPSGSRNMDGRRAIHRSSSLSVLANVAKPSKYRPSTAPALAESPPSFFPVDSPSESVPAKLIILKPSHSTRYTSDFAELGFLGRGGFGSVYHVRNHLDQREYAIKKIVLKNKMLQKIQDGGIEAFEKVMREVNTMAKLDHGNIVRYFGSWIDGLPGEQFVTPVVPAKVDASVGVLGATGVLQEVEVFGEAELLEEALNNEELPGAVVDISDGGIVFAYSDDGDDRIQTLEDSITETKYAAGDLEGSKENEDSMENDNAEDEEPEDDSVELIPRSYPPKVKLATDNSTSPRPPKDHKRSPKVVFDLAPASHSSSGSEITESNPFSAGTGVLIRSAPRPHEKHRRESSAPVVTLHIQMSLYPLVLTSYLSSSHSPQSTMKHCFCLVAALRLFVGLVDGVAYLHQKGIAHRDLKPGNVFLDITPGQNPCKCQNNPEIVVVPKIGDFGLVKEIGGAAGTTGGVHGSSTVGTEFYRPPPGILDEDDVVGRDIFALGVILLELVCKFGTRKSYSLSFIALPCPVPMLTVFVSVGMERVLTLTALACQSKLPVGLEERVAEIVRGCCGFGQYYRHKWDIKRIRKAAMDIVVSELGE